MLVLMKLLAGPKLRFGYALACLIVVAGAAPKIVRDWQKHPAIVEFDAPGDVWAIGDVHGDYARLIDLLRGARLIAGMPETPDGVVWIGGHATLVMTGDMVDKGPRCLDVLRLARALEIASEANGGRAIILAGNHEAEFLADPLAPKSADFAKDLRSAGLEPAQTAACAGEIGEFLCGLPFGARVNDWFFSHGGNSGGRTLAQLKLDLQAGVDAEGFATEQLIGPDSLLEARLNISGKKAERMWTDAGLPQRGPKQLLEDYARALGVRHIVEGHQPSDLKFSDGISRDAGEMFQRDGLLFLIDTGLSRDVGYSSGALLHIHRNGAHTQATGVCADGQTTKLWQDGLKASATRVAPCGPESNQIRANQIQPRKR